MVEHTDYPANAQSYLQTLCGVSPNRRTGSAGNRQATAFFARIVQAYGYEIDATPFDCLDYRSAGARLSHGEDLFEVRISPYSIGCDILAPLVVVSTVAELERIDCTDKLLLMHGSICAEQLAPKNFVFYNPEDHRKIVALLERQRPAGIVTATRKNPATAGAQYPFPLFVDGDFDLPSAYCKDSVGDALAALRGQQLHLQIDAERVASSAANVIAQLNPTAAQKFVVTAHIDAYEDAPGALDNAAGTAVLLLLAEMLADYRGDRCIEIACLNGEDHYSAAGQMDYLRRYGNTFDRIRLVINVDGVGYQEGKSAYSFYDCTPAIEQKAQTVFSAFDGLMKGELWYSGDHMIFVQRQAPAMAFTSERIFELVQTVTHTHADTPDIIDCRKLVEVAASLNALVRAL